MTTVTKSLEELCVHTVRALSIDAVQAANSGHPGLPMGAAPMAFVLWTKHLRHNPSDPHWPDRDRFVLSAGHGSALYYSLLHLCGYELSLDDLRQFRQWGSKTPGHPEVHETAGVEATTGPLGQGHANAVGMAIAERMLAARFNTGEHQLVDHWTYALVGDGDLMEGITAEAASLAGHLALGKLILLYDSNLVSLDGPTSLAFTEDVGARYRSYGWQVLEVRDGDRDLDAIDQALAEAKADAARPSLIIVRTTIGYGSPAKQGTSEAHGAPLGKDEVAKAKRSWGLDPEKHFDVPAEVREHFEHVRVRGERLQREWNQRFEAFAARSRELAGEWRRIWRGELPADFDRDLPRWDAGAEVATRDAGAKAQNALGARVRELVGGDADLSCSTKTVLDKQGSFQAASPAGRNLHFGVREHAMGAIGNGLVYHGGLRAFVSTFFVFSDYMRPAVRLAALNRLPLVYVWTHDSVGLGEDGPTHQPIEHLAALRAMPNLAVVRPADANETAEAWRWALLQTGQPIALVLSRQKLPVLAGTREKARDGLARGGYVLREAQGGTPRLILIATGSEVSLAFQAADLLERSGTPTRVVSLPCWSTFEAQGRAYHDLVLPPAIGARVSIEAGATFGWSRWIEARGRAVGLDRFGASAPGEVNLAKLGMTVESVVAAARAVLDSH